MRYIALLSSGGGIAYAFYIYIYRTDFFFFPYELRNTGAHIGVDRVFLSRCTGEFVFSQLSDGVGG